MCVRHLVLQGNLHYEYMVMIRYTVDTTLELNDVGHYTRSYVGPTD